MPANKKIKTSISYETIIAMSIYTILITSIVAGQNTIKVFSHTVTCGMLIFPLTYILIALSTELCGVKSTRAVIFFTSACNIFMGTIIFLFTKLPSPISFLGSSVLYHNFSCRLSYFLFLSTFAFITSENANVCIISRLNLLTGWKMLLFRTYLSTSCAIIIDSWILFPLSIYFIKNSTIGQTLLDTSIIMIVKMTYDLLMLPIFWMIVAFIRRREMVSDDDTNIMFRPAPYTSVSYLQAKTLQGIK